MDHQAGVTGAGANTSPLHLHSTQTQTRAGAHSVLLPVVALLLCLVGAALRLPAVEQPLGIDQGIFSAAAWGMSEGGALYRDLWDQKPPGIHLIYRVALAMLGPRETIAFWLDYAAFLATTALLVIVGARLVSTAWGWGAAAIYALLGLPPVRFGHGGFLERAVPETFIPVFALAAAALMLSPVVSRHRLRAVLAGVCIGCAALLKPTALVYWPMLLIINAVLEWQAQANADAPSPTPRRSAWARRGAEASWSLLGVSLPLLLCLAWLWHLHALEDARVAIVDYNRAYLAVGYSPVAFANRFVHEVWRLTKTDPLWLLGVSGLLMALMVSRRSSPKPTLDVPIILGGAWLIAALIAAAANGARFYSTYFMPCLVPLSLLAAALLFTHWPHRRRRVLVALLLIIATIRGIQTSVPQRVIDTVSEDVAQWHVTPSSPARLHYLEGFGSYSAGRGFSARANTELSTWLDAHSDPTDRIYIFGMAPGVYFTSHRLPAQRFLWIGPSASNLLPRPDFTLEAVAADLDRVQPRYIIEEHNNRDSLLGWRVEEKFNDPSIRQVLIAYEPVTQIEDFSIYGRR